MYKAHGKIADDIKKNSDLVGEGLIMGGLFVVSKDGVQYQHVEKDFGTVAPIDEVVAATKKAAESVQKA